MKKLKIGLTGLGSRGTSICGALVACEVCDVVAICDLFEDRVDAMVEFLNKKGREKPVCYSNYDEFLKHEGLDAVILSTAWLDHVPLAVKAMRAGVRVAFEVGGSYDLEECWELVRTYEETQTPVFLMENCCWDRFELLATSLVRNGKLGEVVHVNGAYGHDLREHLAQNSLHNHFRIHDYIKRNCENYPTHEIGPISKLLNITSGNKFLTLVSMSSKSVGFEAYNNTDATPNKALAGQRYQQGDMVTTIIKCAGGETITLRLDTTLPRFYSREFNVHGTKGYAYQNGNLVFLDGEKGHLKDVEALKEYMDSAEKYNDYLPSVWRDLTEEEKELGHGGMDYLMIKAFLNAILEGKEMPIDVYEGATWMSITALSEQSIAQGGHPVSFPDFTRGKWMKRKTVDVTPIPHVEEK